MTESAFHKAFSAVLDELADSHDMTNWSKLEECDIDQVDFTSAVAAIVLHAVDDTDPEAIGALMVSGEFRERVNLASEALMLGLLTGKALGFGQAVTP